MRKITLLFLVFFSYMFLVGYAESAEVNTEVNYTQRDFMRTFNASLKSMKLGKYIFSDNQITRTTTEDSSTVSGANDFISTQLKTDLKEKVEYFEFMGVSAFDNKDFDKIKQLIKDTFKDQQLYNVEDTTDVVVEGITFTLKKQ